MGGNWFVGLNRKLVRCAQMVETNRSRARQPATNASSEFNQTSCVRTNWRGVRFPPTRPTSRQSHRPPRRRAFWDYRPDVPPGAHLADNPKRRIRWVAHEELPDGALKKSSARCAPTAAFD